MKKICLLVLIIILQKVPCQAQWEPVVRLSDLTNSRLCFNNAHSIAAYENFVHVVWYNESCGNFEIFYKRSTDKGISWGPDTRLTFDGSESIVPAIAVSGMFVHVVWSDSRNNNDYNLIYYKRSTDQGVSWGPDIAISSSNNIDVAPSICISDSIVHITWYGHSHGWYEIYYNRSRNNGSNWDTTIRITNNPFSSAYPSIATTGQKVHIAWFDDRNQNFEILYNYSTDKGTSWNYDRRLTTTVDNSLFPSLSSSGNILHLVWHENSIRYLRSTDGGISWDLIKTIVSNYSLYPSVCSSNKLIHVLYTHSTIYHEYSSNYGSNWLSDTTFTGGLFGDNPSIISCGDCLHCLWYNSEGLFYKRNPTGNLVYIENGNYEIPKDFSLNQNYPNPFNPSTKITFDLPQDGKVKLVVYDILGQLIKTLVDNEPRTTGKYTIEFDGSNLASGVYFYRLYVESRRSVLADNKTFTALKKMVLIK